MSLLGVYSFGMRVLSLYGSSLSLESGVPQQQLADILLSIIGGRQQPSFGSASQILAGSFWLALKLPSDGKFGFGLLGHIITIWLAPKGGPDEVPGSIGFEHEDVREGLADGRLLVDHAN